MFILGLVIGSIVGLIVGGLGGFFLYALLRVSKSND